MTNSNLSDYADPVVYDAENNQFEPAGPTLLKMAQQVTGPVLDLGCGTGLMSIPLAKQGIDMVSMDAVPEMLAHGKKKAGDLPIRWVEGDVRNFQLDQKFELIYSTGAVFQHLLTRAEHEACLACVQEHLVENGRFIFDLAFPHPKWLGNVEAEEEWFSYTTPDERDVRVSGFQEYDPIRQVKMETAVRRWTDATGIEMTKKAPLSLRYFYPQEIEALMHYNGFLNTSFFGDWQLTPLTAESTMILVLAKKEMT